MGHAGKPLAKPNIGNLQNNAGDTALILASWYDNSECVKLLLEAGANVNLQNNVGSTALSWTSRRSQSKCVKILEEYEKNLRDNSARIIQKHVLKYIYHPSNMKFILQSRKGKW